MPSSLEVRSRTANGFLNNCRLAPQQRQSRDFSVTDPLTSLVHEDGVWKRHALCDLTGLLEVFERDGGRENPEFVHL